VGYMAGLIDNAVLLGYLNPAAWLFVAGYSCRVEIDAAWLR
ncbi:MAG: hypothetical protein QOK42_1425, partial [Frankiaceae bacterium]|nr:hypothetical protein [Frankiaceae bacterium]